LKIFIYYSSTEQGAGAQSYEHSNDPFGSVEGWEFIDKLLT
jgi:hypothetical protein